MKRLPHRRRIAAGFSLIDTTLAIGVMTLMVMPILALLAVGSAEAGKARGTREASALRGELRLRLQEPSWPAEARTARNWKSEVAFDRRGRLIGTDDGKPWVTVELEGMPAPGFASPRFEAVKIRILSARSGNLLDEAVVQRVKES